MVHKLKTWPEYFMAIENEYKKFEIRKDDRNFKVGDMLILQEYDITTKTYTGNEIGCFVEYILRGEQFGIKDGYCVMSINLSRS